MFVFVFVLFFVVGGAGGGRGVVIHCSEQNSDFHVAAHSDSKRHVKVKEISDFVAVMCYE